LGVLLFVQLEVHKCRRQSSVNANISAHFKREEKHFYPVRFHIFKEKE